MAIRHIKVISQHFYSEVSDQARGPDIDKPYKPRRLKQDMGHQLQRKAREAMDRQFPERVRERQKRGKKYAQKFGPQLKQRRQFVQKQKKAFQY